MKRSMVWALLAGLALCGPAVAQTAPVKIGVLTDMSSVYSIMSGPGSVEAARLAIEDFGGSVLGQRVEMMVADHQNKPDIGLSIARHWFDLDGVSMIVDVPTSSVALGVSAYARSVKKLVIISAAAGEQLTEADCSPYTLAWSWDNYSLLKSLVQSMLADGDTTWFHIGPDYSYARTAGANLRSMLEEGGGKLLGETYHPLGATDYSAVLLQAQASGAQVIAISSGGVDAQNMVKQAGEFHVVPAQKLAMLTSVIKDVRTIGLDAMQGTRAVTPFYWDRDAASRAFSDRFSKRAGFVPGETQAGVYSAVLEYLRAVQATGSQDADTVTAYLRSHTIDDVFAQHASLLPNGRMIHDMYLVEVKRPDQSHGPWDLYTIVRTIPGEKAFRPISESKCPLVASAK